MELFHNLAIGFQVALSFQNIFYCLMGCLLGTLIGVLPGIGPVATIAMLLPVTFTLNPTSGSITARSTAARPPLFWSTFRASPRRS